MKKILFSCLALSALAFVACQNNAKPQKEISPKEYAVDALKQMVALAQTKPQTIGDVGAVNVFGMILIAGDRTPRKAEGGHFFTSNGISLFATEYKIDIHLIDNQAEGAIVFVENGFGWWATKWDDAGNANVELVRRDSLQNGDITFTAPVGKDEPEKWHITVPK